MRNYLVRQPPPPPTADKRWEDVSATMRKHGYKAHALIETLHTVQDAFGYLDDKALRFVAGSLHVPLSRVYGVATFYQFFTLVPPGKHTCVLCNGTTCYIKGGLKSLAAVGERYKIKPGETTKDGLFTLLTASCIGTCGSSPAGMFDDEVVGKIKEEEVLKRIRKWVEHDA